MWLSMVELLIRSCFLLSLVSFASLHCEVVYELCVLALWRLFTSFLVWAFGAFATGIFQSIFHLKFKVGGIF